MEVSPLLISMKNLTLLIFVLTTGALFAQPRPTTDVNVKSGGFYNYDTNMVPFVTLSGITSGSSIPVSIEGVTGSGSGSLPVTVQNFNLLTATNIITTTYVTFSRTNSSVTIPANGYVGTAATTNCLPLKLTNAVPFVGASTYITKVRLFTQQTNLVNTWRVHFYNSTNVTANADGVVFKLNYADASAYKYYVELSTAAGTDVAYGMNNTVRHPFEPASGSRDIYVGLQSLYAFTATNSQPFIIEVTTDTALFTTNGFTSFNSLNFAYNETTRPANTTAYSVNDNVAALTSADNLPIKLTNVVVGAGLSGYISGAFMLSDLNTAFDNYRIWFYSGTNVTAQTDNSAMEIRYTNSLTRLGYIDVNVVSAGTDCVYGHNVDDRLPFTAAAADRSIYYQIQSRTGHTPKSGGKYRVTAAVLGK